MANKSDVKKQPKKFFLTEEDNRKLNELLVYFHKNSSGTISTCIEIAYKHIKEESKKNDVEILKGGVIEAQNNILLLKQDFEERLNTILKNVKNLSQSNENRKSDIKKIVEVLHSQPLLKNRESLPERN